MKAVACNQRYAWLIRVTKSFTSMTRGDNYFATGLACLIQRQSHH